jgi:hypothetical protein
MTAATKTEKRCGRCEQTLPADAFGRDRSKRDGLQSYCSGCKASHSSSWWNTAAGRACRERSNAARIFWCGFYVGREGNPAYSREELLAHLDAVLLPSLLALRARHAADRERLNADLKRMNDDPDLAEQECARLGLTFALVAA